MSMTSIVLAMLTGVVAVEPAAATQALGRFRDSVVPVIQRRCLSCHNDIEKKGGFSLETAASALGGGEEGVAIVPGKPDESPLVAMIRVKDGKAEMPKERQPLEPGEVEAIVQWIRKGAEWPNGFRIEQPKVESTDWWSLRPIQQFALPTASKADAVWVDSPIDAFLADKLRERGLTHAPRADRRTLIRRLSFDLVGLPPDWDQVEEFTSDANPDAYDRLVDRFLSSPRYGERWARHWLDVVHFGETHGYDKDKPRPNAWPYRDYIIRAFNDDKPYERFVREQIAGDVLYPGTQDGIEALGFIAAGPWDFIGHAELPESKIDGKIARHLDRDDMVANTVNTFCSLTVDCAQCHNHKFDPITQEDYYSLQSVFAALDRADHEYDADPSVAARRSEFKARRKAALDRRDALRKQVANLGGPPLAKLDEAIASAGKGETPAQHGYHSQIESSADVVKWVQIDLGRPVEIDRVDVVGCHDDFNGIGAGFGFPPRFKIECSDDSDFRKGVATIVDQTAADAPNPGISPLPFHADGRSGQFVRVTATKLAYRQNDFIFALAEVLVFDKKGENVARGAAVSALDSIEAPERWCKANLVDGVYARVAKSKAEAASLRAERESLIRSRVPVDVREPLAALESEISKLDRDLAALPAPKVAYIGTVHTGSGSFVGTGGSGGKPRPVFVLARGDVTKPGKEVSPGAIAAISTLPARFDIFEGAPEGDRRAALARWITDERHPLTWRSIVNRVWLYHFGRGIVDTPNDFGRMGQSPTHPELLDFLASDFRDTGGSLKRLHRLLVTSAAYRQTSTGDARLSAIDVDNRYLWRANRRRLEAEAVRDSILQAAGRLDLSMGGPSFQDFVIDKPEHSPHYEYQLHDADDPKSHRRSIYRFLVRSQQQPFMATMDCADPSMLVEKRNQTISPLQALALLNNPLSTAMADHFAERVSSAGDLRAQVRDAFRLALGRWPGDQESAELAEYARRHGLANACRAILNLNEFVFVD